MRSVSKPQFKSRNVKEKLKFYECSKQSLKSLIINKHINYLQGVLNVVLKEPALFTKIRLKSKGDTVEQD